MLAIVQDYVKHKKPSTFEELQEAFPGKLGGGWNVVGLRKNQTCQREAFEQRWAAIALPSGKSLSCRESGILRCPKNFSIKSKFGN